MGARVSPDGPAAAPPQTVRRSRQHLQQSRGTAGQGSQSLRAGAPALHPGVSAVWAPTLLSVPPLPPEVSVPPPRPPPLLLTDGLVLGVRSWAGSEEEMLCQGEKVGCCGGL